MEKNKDMNEEELKAQQEETLDNVATSQQDEWQTICRVFSD